MKQHTFPKHERMKGSTHPSMLFQEGEFLAAQPLHCRFFFKPSAIGSYEVLFSVPKKKCPSAVQRNRIKRLMREAWRLHASPLREQCGKQACVLYTGIYYQSSEELPFAAVEAKIKYIIRRLKEHHAKTHC